MSDGNTTSGQSSRSGWRSRVFYAGVILVAVTGITWAAGGFSAVLNRLISAAMTSRDYDRAEWLIQMTRTLRSGNAETKFWEARLSRKQLRISEVPPLLVAAAEGGYEAGRIRQEYLLLEAQTGRIRNVADELNRLLQDAEDGAEICEAYVNGAMMAGATDVALTILSVWKSEYPADPQPYYALARILEYQQDIPGALQNLSEAIGRNPDHWPSRYARGRMLYGENRIEESLTDLRHAARMKRNTAPLYQQARCLRSLSRLKDAHQILSELVLRPAAEIRASFNEVGEPMSGRPIEYELGSLEAVQGNHAAARRWLETVLEDDPNHLDARYARAMSLRELGDLQEANSELSEVQRIRTMLQEIDRLVDEINRSPDLPHLEARCRVGELFLRYENARHGEFWLRETLNRDPNYRPAHRLLADYYRQLAVKEPAYQQLADEHHRAAASEGDHSLNEMP